MCARLCARPDDDDDDVDDDVGLHVLGCRVDILGTNCNKLLKTKDERLEEQTGVASASVRVIVFGGQQVMMMMS